MNTRLLLLWCVVGCAEVPLDDVVVDEIEAAPEAFVGAEVVPPEQVPLYDPAAVEPEPEPEAMDSGLPVAFNVAPTCHIVLPISASFSDGTSIAFEADVQDPDDDAHQVIWRSDLYGPMVLGNAFGFILPAGVHEVSVTATDPAGGSCEDRVIVEVLAP